jgi:murein DD-endopeptidase MepM/ murein hydrolase activator NlpD
MRGRKARGSWTVTVTLTGFLAGALVMAFVDRGFPHVRLPPVSSGWHPTDIPLSAQPMAVPVSREDPVASPIVPTPMITPLIEADPLAELRSRHLELPVEGAIPGALRDSFDETRGSTHRHEAIDIMAPRNTPILAVEDGTIARLFESEAGGTTVYQFDPSSRYVYYYAHLQRYADGLQEGHHVQRRQVLGYVGTSGNAPKDTPHLHFAIFRLTEKKHWWDGRPIDPYTVLK